MMVGTAHPWHDVTVGDAIPNEVIAVIEIPSGSRTKYELDKPSGLIRLDRVLFSPVHYPANYGLIPQTYYSDGDPLDILVICSEALVPMSLVKARIIGMMEMIDSDMDDNKIIAVAANDASLAYVKNIEDLPPHTTHEFRNFFEDYKKLEGKSVQVLGFKGRSAAFACIMESIALYKQEIKATVKKQVNG
ncbi:inorganic diphosphatase [Olivibacter ginsenosidimutans]|uniref:Inorganic pyrophosphatase n=1 Tax=Olivibacter ginsenosidimutans TaxID=1176537 RepID=A0ABP9AVE4_9SPHI